MTNIFIIFRYYLISKGHKRSKVFKIKRFGFFLTRVVSPRTLFENLTKEQPTLSLSY